MQHQITIVKACADDAAVLTGLSVTTFVESYAAYNTKEAMDSYLSQYMTLQKLTSELLDPDNTFYLAYYNSILAGYAKLRSILKPGELQQARPLEIERIYVHAPFQKKKIGAALMSKCIEHASGNNYDVIWLGVWEHNPGAIAFYKKWGFEIFGSHIFPFGNEDQVDLMMKKHLNSGAPHLS